MMSFIYALDAAVEEPMGEMVQRDGLVILLCALAGTLLLASLICIGVAVYRIRKERKDGDK